MAEISIAVIVSMSIANSTHHKRNVPRTSPDSLTVIHLLAFRRSVKIVIRLPQTFLLAPSNEYWPIDQEVFKAVLLSGLNLREEAIPPGDLAEIQTLF